MNSNPNFHESERPAGDFAPEARTEPQFPPFKPLGMSKVTFRIVMLILWGIVLGPTLYYLLAGAVGRF